MILVGELSLWVALLMSLWAATVSFAGGSMGRRDLVASGERAILATLVMVLLAAAGLWTAIFAHDFSIKYVASFTTANLPRAYLVVALWAGLAGKLLLWCLILAVVATVALWTNRKHNRLLLPFVTGVLGVVLTVFLATICLGANPFERLDWLPPEGEGLSPLLQRPEIAIHLPILYFGYAATVVLFSFAVAALLARRLDAEWFATMRNWAVVAWFLNTISIMLGMWSAYVEPGLSGYWASEPLHNASLLLWIAISAFLLSIMLQAKRGKLNKWNVTLVARNRLRYGGYIAVPGILLVCISLAGQSFSKQYDAIFKAGDAHDFTDPFGHRWHFVSQGISNYDVLNRQVSVVLLDVSRDGKPSGVITSERRLYIDSRGAPTFAPTTAPGIRSTVKEDVYVLLAGVRSDDAAQIHVTFNPLVRWMWVGGGLIGIGGLIAMWPATDRKVS